MTPFDKFNWTMLWIAVMVFSVKFSLLSTALLGMFMALYNAGFIGELVKWLDFKIVLIDVKKGKKGVKKCTRRS